MSKGQQTKTAILDEAVGIASQVGFNALTIGQLADQTGMSKSGLFAHFKSKEALQVAILEEAASRFVAGVVSPALRKPRGEPRVRALYENWLQWIRSDFLPGGCIFIQAMVELDDRPGAARDRLVSTQRDWIDTLATAARIAREEGHFRADLDPEQLAQELVQLADGYHLLARTLRDPAIDARMMRAYERLLRDARGE